MSISTDSTNSVEFSSDDCGESFIDQQKLKQIGEKFAKMELVLKNTKLELKNKGLQEKLKEYEMSALLAKIEAENGKLKNEIEKMQEKMDEKEKQYMDKLEELHNKAEAENWKMKNEIEKMQAKFDKKEEQMERKLEELQKKLVEMENEQKKSIERMEKKTLQEELEKKLMEQNVTLQAKVDKLEMEKQKEKTLFGRIGELEGQQKHQKQQGEKESNELVGQIRQLKEEQKKYLERVNELEKHQKQMQQERGVSIFKSENLQDEQKRKNNSMEDNNEKQMQMALLNFRQNCWDAKACQNELEITKLTVHCHKGKCYVIRTAFATHPILFNKDFSKIFYFEISVKNMSNSPFNLLSFGFAVKRQKIMEEPFSSNFGTFAYSNDGFFTINGKWMRQKEQKIDSFKENDVVGCGINSATRQIFFTKNGRRQGPFYLIDNSPNSVQGDLFPFVSFYAFGDKIQANFGPNFKFNLATL